MHESRRMSVLGLKDDDTASTVQEGNVALAIKDIVDDRPEENGTSPQASQASS